MITLAMIVGLLMPPKQYDHYPTKPFIIVEYTNEKLFNLVCPQYVDKITLACVTVDRRVIRIRSDLTPKARQKVLRHEYGHLNGWNHV